MNTNEYSSVDKYLNKIKKFLVLLSLQSTSNERSFAWVFVIQLKSLKQIIRKAEEYFRN